MKFGTILYNEKHTSIIQGNDGAARLLTDVCKTANLPLINSTLELVELTADNSTLLNQLSLAVDKTASIPNSALDWLAPITRPSKILGVAFNNKELMKQAHFDPGVPNYFLKPPSALQGHQKPIRIDPKWGAVIPEPEVCAIIGKRAKDITEDQALDHVFGYAIHNDVTSHGLKFGKDSIAVTYDPDMAREEFFKWRNLHGDDDRDVYYVYHTRSKGTDTFAPIGPWMTTADEVLDPNNLTVKADIDGEVFTVDHTSNYRFTIQRCIAEASRFFTLEPGDIISFGTTGKGQGRFPRGHKSVLMGEMSGTIGIEIEPLGRLENSIEHFEQLKFEQ